MNPLIAGFSDEPILVAPDRHRQVETCLRGLLSDEQFGALALRTGLAHDDDFWDDDDPYMSRLRPYNVHDGVLQIPVLGVLVNRFPYQFGRYATGYTYIEKAFARGLADGNVRGIAFIVDSPGGEAAGNFELVDKLYEGRGQKPMRSFVADYAYSGGFSIATAADQVIVTRSGGTGSVGVVTMHVDFSGALEQMGVKVNFIFAGKHKVDGNPYQELTESARARIQDRINKIYGVFVETVSRNRGMDEKDVRETEALTYDAAGSIEVGFADRIGSLDEEMAVFSDEVAEENGDGPMTKNVTTQEPAVETVTAADRDAAVSDARTAAVTAERERIKAITGCDEAKGREAVALKMALTTDLSAEQAAGLLADMPKAEPKAEAPKAEAPKPAARNHFAEAMNQSDNPAVGAGEVDDQMDDEDKAAASILSAHRSAAGVSKRAN